MDATVPATAAGHDHSSGYPHAHHPHADEQHRLVWLLLEAMRALGLHRPDPALPGTPVSVSEGLALAELAHQAPPSQQQLADRLQLEKSSVSRLVANLEARGLVSRQRDPANRRWSQVTLTDRGRATATQLIARFHQRHQRLFAALHPAERQALATGLAALVRAAAEAGEAEQPQQGTSPSLHASGQG
jgi:DNA-binding MarR family transcriptional regulator